MGSFNATCIVSGLPIQAGDAVRYLALTESKHNPSNKWSCYVSGRWQLRTVPLRAEYNDYGSVENIQPGLVERVFFKSFDLDVVEKGVGDNQCHDVHVRKGMSQAEWLTALWEGRVFVRSQYGWNTMTPEELYVIMKKQDEGQPKGIPTLARIEAVLKANDLPVTTEYGAQGFVLDEVNPGFLRVRFGRSSGETKKLEKLVPVLVEAGFAAMLTCGTGSYANNAEILVAPRPTPEGQHHHTDGVGESAERNRPLGVSLAMIREDVWQILLNTKIADHWQLGEVSIGLFRTAAEKLYKEEAAFTKKLAKTPEKDRGRLIIDRYAGSDEQNNILQEFLRPGEGISGFALKAAFQLAKKLHQTPAELKAFLNDLAETLYVQWMYSHLHGQWHPTTNSGQEGNWKDHRDFLRKLDALAQAKYEENEEEENDDDALQAP